MNTTVYVVTHKNVGIPKKDGYKTLYVGSAINNATGTFDFRDDSGDNISDKNKSYCELTGVYWIWKNETTDKVGVVHYRRFFAKNLYSASPDNILGIEEIDNVLSHKRVILPVPKNFKTSVLQGINYAPNISDMAELYEAINKLAPEYIDDYNWFLHQNKSYLYNMCIMKRADFNSYCEWLFPILKYVEEIHDMEAETDAYRKRLFGFLSERLIMVWVHHNIAKEQIIMYPVLHTEETALQRIRHDVANKIRGIQYALVGGRASMCKADELLYNRICRGQN